ncbi:MAG TPA: glycoside hydrolase, partial [Anaerolineae bacterium]|nr:glycoside hydrolase [Anaerolineae bacterium]
MEFVMVWFRPKNILFAFALILIVAIIFVIFSSPLGATPAASTAAPLQPIHVFTDTPSGQWVGSGDGKTIEIDNGNLPVDTGQMNNGFPSYRLNTSGDTGWWIAILAGASWESYSLEPFHPNGALEFNIKGLNGNEQFNLALSDIVFERNPKWCEPTKLAITDYVTISTNWQHVTIPISDLVSDFSCQPSTTDYQDYASGTFDLTQIYSIVLSSDISGTMTTWLNDIQWTTTANEPEFPPIKVNQLGYTPNSDKYALISGFPDVLTLAAGTTFNVRQVSNGNSVYQGTLSLLSNNDAATGERVLKADFSNLATVGDYYVSISGYENSVPFTISETIFDNLVVDSMRYYFLQRQGIALTGANAGVWTHDVGHPQDASVPLESDANNTRDVMQGWYDAGDYGKYVNAGATAVSDLLWSYELFSAEFPDNQLNIPESGNG